MAQHSLQEALVQALASEQVQLPAFPAVALKLQQALQDRNTKFSDLQTMIVGDQALASQVLRAANSSMYKGFQNVTTIQKAIVRLGIRQVAMLAMAVSQRSMYLIRNPVLRDYLEKLWQHAMASALGSQWIARRCNYEQQADHAFMAGLLHNIGQLVILRALDMMYTQKRLAVDYLPTALLDELLDGNMHNAQGYVLMKRWNLPEEYCVVTRDHHRQPCDTNNLLLVMVRLIDQCCAKLGIGVSIGDPQLALAATLEAEILGLGEVALAELEILLEDSVLMANQID